MRNERNKKDSPQRAQRGIAATIHDDVIICAYVTTPFDKLRVIGHGELVEP